MACNGRRLRESALCYRRVKDEHAPCYLKPAARRLHSGSRQPRAGGAVAGVDPCGEDEEEQENRVLILKEGKALEFGTTGDALVSIDATPDGMAYVLAEQGDVFAFNWQSPTSKKALKAGIEIFENDTAYETGPLRRLRILGGEVLCGGTCGQMYQLKKGKLKKLRTGRGWRRTPHQRLCRHQCPGFHCRHRGRLRRPFRRQEVDHSRYSQRGRAARHLPTARWPLRLRRL